MSDSTDKTDESAAKTNWWQRLSGGLKRTSSTLGSTLDRACRQAPARSNHGGRDRGGADPRRPRRRCRGQCREGDRRGALRVRDHARGSEGGGRRRGREGVDAGRQAAGGERRKTFRRAGGRRQRLGQDHDHRQARRQAPRRRPLGDARRRRHLSRGGDRSAENLGRPLRRDRARPRARFGRRRPCLRRVRGSPRRGDRRAARSTPPAACRTVPS